MGTAFVFVLLALLAICGLITGGLVLWQVLDDAKRRMEDRDMQRDLREHPREQQYPTKGG